jgi:hypothetical protein
MDWPKPDIEPSAVTTHNWVMDRTIFHGAHGAEFDFRSQPVGLFRDQAFPTLPGEYAHEPYRGPGHYDMQVALKRGDEVICNYMLDDKRVSFRVLSCPRYGVLNLHGFSVGPPMSVELIGLAQLSDNVYAMTFRDALGEHVIQTRWLEDGVTEGLADHGSVSRRANS